MNAVNLIKNSYNNIIIYGVETLGESTYDFLKLNGIKPTCYCDNAVKHQGMSCLGLPIYNHDECIGMYKNSIFIIANENYGTMKCIKDQLINAGFCDNKEIFWACDIIEKMNNPYLPNVLCCEKVALIGQTWLCKILKQELEKNNIMDIVVFENKIENHEKIKKHINENREIYWFIVTRDAFYPPTPIQEKVYNLLKKYGAKSISTRFSRNLTTTYMCKYERNLRTEVNGTNFSCTEEPQKSVIESVDSILYHVGDALSGTLFFASLFRKHKNVLYLDYTLFQAVLLFIIQQINRVVAGEQIAWKIITKCNEIFSENNLDEKAIQDEEKFVDEFKKITSNKKNLTEKEIFVSTYIAYHRMKGKNFNPKEKYIIYFEPHSNGDMENVYSEWFKNNFKVVKILRIVRDPIKCLGANIRHQLRFYGAASKQIIHVVKTMQEVGLEKQENDKDIEKICIRFEDLKLYPLDMFRCLCDKLKLSWDEEMLVISNSENEDTNNMWGISSVFDPKPVYYAYDEYFPSFDRLRLDILLREKEKAYGYYYIDLQEYCFSKEQLKEWYKIPYQVEKMIDFTTEKQREEFRKKMYYNAIHTLEILENKDSLEEYFNFDEYIKVER